MSIETRINFPVISTEFLFSKNQPPNNKRSDFHPNNFLCDMLSNCFIFPFFFLVNKLIAQEGPFFLQMRIKHLLKSNCIPQATALSKLCAESKEISNVSSFQQAYITCLCSILPNEDAIKEVSKANDCCCHSHLL